MPYELPRVPWTCTKDRFHPGNTVINTGNGPIWNMDTDTAELIVRAVNELYAREAAQKATA